MTLGAMLSLGVPRRVLEEGLASLGLNELVDSIVDIVGTAICVDYVGADHVVCRVVPTGFGTVECACGTLPVPAPAVCAILEQTGLPHVRGEVEQELLTPTGAAILSGIVDEFLEDGAFEEVWTHAKAGRLSWGTGKRDTGLPPLTIRLVS